MNDIVSTIESLFLFSSPTINAKANWIGHMLRRNCIIRDVIEGKIEGKRSLERRKLEVLGDLRKKRKYWELKDEAQEREP